MSFTPWQVELLADSINPVDQRLMTYKVTMPRSILAECNTHRVFSRNAASSRAVPTRLFIERVMTHPYIPDWTKKSKGMSGKPMIPSRIDALNAKWLGARDRAIADILELVTLHSFSFSAVGRMSYEEIAAIIDSEENAPHKQDINRILEPWLFMDWIVSATEWSNFSFQRVHHGAHPAFQRIAYPMTKLRFTHNPKRLDWGEWHLPLTDEADRAEVLATTAFPTHGYRGGPIDGEAGWVCQSADEVLARISTARCGRVSFLKTDKRDIDADLKWFHDHIWRNAATGEPQHVSPAEHAAYAERGRHGNFFGWRQLRADIPGENYSHYSLVDLNRYEESMGYELTEG